MSRAASGLLTLILVLGVATPVAAAEPDPAPTAPAVGEIVPGEVVVKYREPARAAGLAAARGLQVMAELGSAPDEMPVLVSTEGRPVAQVLAALNADPAVEYAEPNYVVGLAVEPTPPPPAAPATQVEGAVTVNDPRTGEQYSLDRMQVRGAWELSTGGSGVVAVLDTGVQWDHPDLAGRLLPGYDFVNDDADATDDNGHGTWVSGIIAANANDGYGIAGISWSDRILPVKIMGSNGMGNTSDLTSGIIWAANNGATVINMSVGGFPYSQYVADAVNYAWSKGVVLVGAAGNNRRLETYYPASYDNVISVSATQADDEFTNWSSYGSKVDVSAPGASVLTTNCTTCNTWGSHTAISGTSFATPNVAGVVALLRARFPGESPGQIVNRLFAAVDDHGYAGWDNRYGLGRVNASRALGGGTSASGVASGDSMEPNNSLSGAVPIPLGASTRPTIHPAGDVDVFAVDLPRAGRLEVRVTGVVDSARAAKNALPIDPMVEIYTAAGTLLTSVDREWESGTELATWDVSGSTRLLIRIRNWYANGNTAAYRITPTYVDTVAPSVSLVYPGNLSAVGRFVSPVVGFGEPVQGVSATTFTLRDTTTGALVPAQVSYDAQGSTARLTPQARLEPSRQYALEVSGGVRDLAGNPAGASWTMTTGATIFVDTANSAFAAEIDWLAERGITLGCGQERFCPLEPVTREQMASFLARALALPASSTDFFADDATSGHHDDINRLAQAGITNGCAAARFCPSGMVLREQMASFLARARQLPTTSVDYFTDDERSGHEADINRMAAAGVTQGCGPAAFCPTQVVTREQMAAFLYRAFSGGASSAGD